MRAWLSKSFPYKFILTEQSLRSVYNVMTQQMKQVTDNFTSLFEIKFRDGATTEKNSLEEVLAEENSGIWKIRKLTIRLHDAAQMKVNIEILLKFTANKESISYEIDGIDRIWVSNTDIFLEKSIKSIKNKFRSPVIDALIIPISLFIGIFSLYFLSNNDHSIVANIIIFSSFGFIFLSLFLYAVSFIIPEYNFCWGDYNQSFETRQSIVKYLILGILATLILGVLISIIANYITFEHIK
jgi:hypothetical protein